MELSGGKGIEMAANSGCGSGGSSEFDGLRKSGSGSGGDGSGSDSGGGAGGGIFLLEIGWWSGRRGYQLQQLQIGGGAFERGGKSDGYIFFKDVVFFHRGHDGPSPIEVGGVEAPLTQHRRCVCG